MKHTKTNANKTDKGFTLIELMIVVSILGIVSAIAFPTFKDHVAQAKEAAAKDNLRVLREAINRYAIQHKDVPPGYANSDPSNTPNELAFGFQMIKASTEDGALSNPGTAGYPYGPYLPEIPTNPFNGLSSVTVLTDTDSFPSPPPEDTGWIYKPLIKEIRLNTAGTDSQGKSFYDY
ncbi:Pilin [Anaerohalosphaera lusitana]|uniref:Pilin n=1 Tax=Anaerohalosphaera lusitana TaxID=1936003 RepID=A0A1U9NGY5_9BACT|nr:prepilin-type N-terminal cleavage/methylation domain-containing protein [Anaerohalosphaera lusitana]AQT67065.1 Pilin [Anaerohalosphaera lusitana]